MPDDRYDDRPRRRPRGTFRIAALVLATAFLFGAAVILVRGVRQVGESLPSLPDVTLSETTIQEVAHATLQRESPERFLVTGRLDVTATTEVENTRRVLPGVLDLSLGTSRAQIRVPGRVFYGVDLATFSTSDIRLVSDSVVSVDFGPVRVQAVEPLLERMEVRTERGWARLPDTDRQAERRAVELLRSVLRQQGAAHLADARQPRLNTARAVAALLVPVLQGAGIRDPVVRVVLGGETWTVRPRAGASASGGGR